MSDCEYACLLVLFAVVLSCCSGFSMSLFAVKSALCFFYFSNVLRQLFLLLWV